LLEVYNAQLADVGSKILSKRLSIIKRLEDASSHIHKRLTDEEETIRVEYVSTVLEHKGQIPDSNSDSYVIDRLGEKLKEARGEEIRRGLSLAGPHRDDIAFHVNGINLRAYGSQGQQRTAAISLKMGEVELIKEDIGEYPIILLDDVFSELDSPRSRAILETLSKEAQVFLTTVNLNGLAVSEGDASLFLVSSGEVENYERK
jgi:DNA replication and repair protein RecF